MSLYNMKENGKGYVVSKFDEDLNPESSYHVSGNECDCPAGHRPICRHRQMLPVFQQTGRVNTSWFLEFDNREWFYLDHEHGLVNSRQVRKSWRRL